MVIAIIATLLISTVHHHILLLILISIGGIIGLGIGLKIRMTAVPQLIAGFHSLVGLAAVLIAYCAFLEPESFHLGTSISKTSLIEMSLGLIIGAITFSGSIIAFLKLQGLISSIPLRFRGQSTFNAILALAIVALFVTMLFHPLWVVFFILTLLSVLLGFTLILPIGGADMPVVISMLNSYSGWAAAGIGFTLSNHLLVITGALVGASGAILSYIMCISMNRSIWNVIFGRIKGEQNKTNLNLAHQMATKSANGEDAAFLLSQAHQVIIVPGYGLAVCSCTTCGKRACRCFNPKRNPSSIRNSSCCRTHARSHECFIG